MHALNGDYNSIYFIFQIENYKSKLRTFTSIVQKISFI